MLKYFTRIGISLSVLINVIFGGKCNQTFSARNYQWKRENKFNLVYILDLLFFDEYHCKESWIWWIVHDDLIQKNYEEYVSGKQIVESEIYITRYV